jgi:hypothetical protein
MLSQLSLQRIESGEWSFEVVATVLGPRDEPLEEPAWRSLAAILAGRVNRAIEEKTPEDRRPIGIASSKVDYSDHANCEHPNGEQVNAFLAGERCYRIVLQVVTAAK